MSVWDRIGELLLGFLTAALPLVLMLLRARAAERMSRTERDVWRERHAKALSEPPRPPYEVQARQAQAVDEVAQEVKRRTTKHPSPPAE